MIHFKSVRGGGLAVDSAACPTIGDAKRQIVEAHPEIDIAVLKCVFRTRILADSESLTALNMLPSEFIIFQPKSMLQLAPTVLTEAPPAPTPSEKPAVSLEDPMMLKSIKKLVAMGLGNEEDAGFALRVAGFNEDKAANKLLKGLKRDPTHPGEKLRDKIIQNPEDAVETISMAIHSDSRYRIMEVLRELGLNLDAFDLSALGDAQQQSSAEVDGGSIDLPDFLEKVQQLVEMGFSEDEVLGALLATNQNVEASLNRLCEGEGPNLAGHPLVDVRRRLRGSPSSCVEICHRFIETCTFQGPGAQQTRRNVMNHPDDFMREVGLNPAFFDIDAIRRSFENEPAEGNPLGRLGLDDIYPKVRRLHERFNNGELSIGLVLDVLVQSDLDEERAAQTLGEMMH